MEDGSMRRLAARNNAEWCDLVCRSHGVPGSFTDALWLNAGHVPPYYPNAVALEPGAGVEQALRELVSRHDGPLSVKDSFAALDLSASGFRPLFQAEWLLAPPPGPGADAHPDPAVRVVEDAPDLAAWESAWNGGEPIGLFRPSLLAADEVRFLAVVDGGSIVAGAVASRSADVVGLSNVFLPDGWTRHWDPFLRAARQHFPGLPVVGYEQGADLTAALDAGCRSIGALTVWLRDV